MNAIKKLLSHIPVRSRGSRRSRVLGLLLFVFVVAASVLPAFPQTDTAFAAGGDIDTLDFVAAGSFTYNHPTGGGAFNNRTIGKTSDVVESLETNDFTCGDHVTYLTHIVVTDSPVDANQTIALDYTFSADTTGQSGFALSDIVGVSINYGNVENGDNGSEPNPGAGSFGLDSGINDDRQTVAGGDTGTGGSTATLTYENKTGPDFQKGSELEGTVEIDDLEAGEELVLRIDVILACDPGSSPTGNLYAKLADARVVSPVQDAISGGAQTVPFKVNDNPTAVTLSFAEAQSGTSAWDLRAVVGLVASLGLVGVLAIGRRRRTS